MRPGFPAIPARPASARRLRAAALCLALAACAAPRPVEAPRIWPGAERMFHADPRWLGGDAVISVDLGDSRILWLFGDSFVDPRPPWRRAEAAFIRNAVALQQGPDPARAAMSFIWRIDAKGEPASFFPETGDAWFWPGAGIVADDGALAVFLHRIAPADAAPPLDFADQGYAVAYVETPRGEPSQWRLRIFSAPAPAFPFLPGSAAIRDGDHVVALAVRRQGGAAATLVRWRMDGFMRGDLARAEWWGGPARGWRAANDLPGGPAIVIDDAGPESSVHADGCGGFFHVASRGFGASDIVMRRAPALTGPWSAPTPLLRPPESEGARPFVYAGKAHDGLAAPPGALPVSWIANSFTPEDLLAPAGEAALYWPRMALVPAPRCD